MVLYIPGLPGLPGLPPPIEYIVVSFMGVVALIIKNLNHVFLKVCIGPKSPTAPTHRVSRPTPYFLKPCQLLGETNVEHDVRCFVFHSVVWYRALLKQHFVALGDVHEREEPPAIRKKTKKIAKKGRFSPCFLRMIPRLCESTGAKSDTFNS